VSVVDGDPERVTAYERTPATDDFEGDDHDADPDPLLVVVNFADRPVTVEVPAGFETDLFAGDGSGAVDEGVTVESVAVLR